MHNEKQDNQVAPENRGNLKVLKTLLQTPLEAKSAEQDLKNQQPGKRSQFLIFKTDDRNLMEFGLDFCSTGLEVRKSEYARLAGEDRQFVKGQKYTLLSHWENLSLDGRVALKTLLKANKRLNTAYLLKESFGQLWDYKTEGWARRFFDNWRSSLKWQRLKPYEEFAQMIESHWNGIAAYINTEEKVSLGFVEGFEQQDSRYSAQGLWVEGSGIPAPQGAHLHVTGAISLKKYPLAWEKTRFF
jgi:hypothetical protein